MQVDADLVQLIRSYIVQHGIAVPGWGAEAERHAFESTIAEALVRLNLSRQVRHVPDVARQIARRLTGMGVLQPFLDDPADTIQEIIVRQGWVQVERSGSVQNVGDLAPDEEFAAIVERTGDMARRQATGSRPYVLVDLPGGARFTAIKPPLSAAGIAINIRRFPRTRLDLAALQVQGAFLPSVTDAGVGVESPPSTSDESPLVSYLSAVARSVSASLLISGEFSSGKSTLLGALASLVSDTRQVAIVETFREVQVAHPYPLRVVVPGDRPDFPSMDEVLNVVITRMRPDLLIVGEIVRDEAPRFLDAVNLGKRAWATIHAGSALGALQRLETKALISGLPHRAVREQIAHSVNMVVHLARFGHRRRVAEVALVEGLTTGGNYALRYLPVGRVGARSALLAELWGQVGGTWEVKG
jgi:pilus assembly protein CpaF